MKQLSIFLILSLVSIPSAYGAISDRTGLSTHLQLTSGGHDFELQTASNFDILDYEFDSEEKKLTLIISSGLENNLGEIQIPKNLIGGNFTFYLNDQEFFPKVKGNEKISFVTFEFQGTGKHTLDIIGSTYLDDLEQIIQEENETLPEEKVSEDGGGCLIATATYGTELAPQVQQLREIRDDKLLQTAYGQYFMELFNAFYYSFSPVIADLERESPVFKEAVKLTLTPLISSLSILNYVEMDSETKVLAYGISLILLNVGMYFVTPVIVITKLWQKF